MLPCLLRDLPDRDRGPGGVRVRIPVNPMPEQQDREESDCLIALERFQDENDFIVSSEDLRKPIALQD